MKKSLNMVHHRDLIEFLLPNGEEEQFAEWAFGENFIYGGCIPAAWNRLHSDKKIIFQDGKIMKDLIDMVEIWRNRNKK